LVIEWENELFSGVAERWKHSICAFCIAWVADEFVVVLGKMIRLEDLENIAKNIMQKCQ